MATRFVDYKRDRRRVKSFRDVSVRKWKSPQLLRYIRSRYMDAYRSKVLPPYYRDGGHVRIILKRLIKTFGGPLVAKLYVDWLFDYIRPNYRYFMVDLGKIIDKEQWRNFLTSIKSGGLGDPLMTSYLSTGGFGLLPGKEYLVFYDFRKKEISFSPREFSQDTYQEPRSDIVRRMVTTNLNAVYLGTGVV